MKRSRKWNLNIDLSQREKDIIYSLRDFISLEKYDCDLTIEKLINKLDSCKSKKEIENIETVIRRERYRFSRLCGFYRVINEVYSCIEPNLRIASDLNPCNPTIESINQALQDLKLAAKTA